MINDSTRDSSVSTEEMENEDINSVEQTEKKTEGPQSENPDSKEEKDTKLEEKSEAETETKESESEKTSSEGSHEDEQQPTDEVADEEEKEQDSDKKSEAIPQEEASEGLNDILQEILDDENKFEDTLDEASIPELSLMLERFAELDDNFHSVVPYGGKIKRAFNRLSQETEEEENSASVSRFNTALAKYNRRRKEHFKKLEEEKAENSKIKGELLEKLKAIVDEGNAQAIDKVRNIQNKWKATGWVLSEDMHSFNSRYKHYLDTFYQLRGMHRDLLKIDHENNMGEKLKIIEEVKALIPEDKSMNRETWREKSEKLRDLHEVWKTIGWVPEDKADEINLTFKNLLEEFYNLRQKFYEQQDESRKENQVKKEEILKEMEKFREFSGSKARDWNSATKNILSYQEDWKKIGPGPSSENKNLWKRYREICDAFFNKKSEFFKKFDDIRNENLEKKRELVAKAEAIKDSTDWKKTGDELKRLQKEWKNIGPVHEKHSNRVWKQFRKACDHFFNRRDEDRKEMIEGQKENQKKKEALIAEMKKLEPDAKKADEFRKKFRELNEQWKSIGFVPFKEKDKINKSWKEAVDSFFSKLDASAKKHGISKMESRFNVIGDEDQRDKQISNEMSRLHDKKRRIQKELDSLEANMGRISPGKSGDSLREMIQKQVDQEKKKINDIQAKIDQLKEIKAKADMEAEKNEEPAENDQAESKDEPAGNESASSDESSSEDEGKE